MKVNLRIEPSLTEDRVSIEARLMTESIAGLVSFAEGLGRQEQIQAKKDGDIYLLDAQDIYRLVIENRQVQLKTREDSYQVSLPLYRLGQMLPDYFLQISQSELINSRQISHLRLTANGLVQIFLKNGDWTYSSRRYLKSIKERLKL